MPLSTKEASQRNVVPFTVVFWVVTQIFAQRKRGRFMTSQTYKKKKFSFVEQENMLKFACLIGRIHACVSLVLAVRLRTWAKQTLTAWPLCLFRFNHWSQEEKNRHRAHLRWYVSKKICHKPSYYVDIINTAWSLVSNVNLAYLLYVTKALVLVSSRRT